MNVPAREDSCVIVGLEDASVFEDRESSALDNCSSSSQILLLSTSGLELETKAVDRIVAAGECVKLEASAQDEAFEERPETTIDDPLAEGVGNGGIVTKEPETGTDDREIGTDRTKGSCWTRLGGA